MENFKDIKRMRNIKDTIVGEKLNGHRCEIPREIIENMIIELDNPKKLDTNNIQNFLLKQRLINLLTIDNFEIYI